MPAPRDLGARRAATWAAFLAHDGNVAHTASALGLDRGTVREHLDRGYGPGLVALVRYRAEARARLRAYVASKPVVRCWICGAVAVPFSRGRWATCEPHRWARDSARLTCDPERHAKHTARGRSKQPPRRRFTGGTNRDQRWVVPGSQFHALCREAYAHGWPLLDRLPAPILAQLAAEETSPQG